MTSCTARTQAAGATAGEHAWLEEVGQGILCGLRVNTRLTALLADAKAGAAGEYAHAALAALELSMLSAAVVATHMEKRSAWMRDVLQHVPTDAAGEDDGAPWLRLFEMVPLPARLAGGGLLLLDDVAA